MASKTAFSPPKIVLYLFEKSIDFSSPMRNFEERIQSEMLHRKVEIEKKDFRKKLSGKRLRRPPTTAQLDMG